MFDLGVKNGFELHQYINVIFEYNIANDKTNGGSIFNEMNVTECFCKTGSVTYPEDGMSFNNDTDNYNVAYKENIIF